MYTVELLPLAALDLADLWLSLGAAQQGAVLAALTVVKQGLTADPFGHGESRDRGRRVMFAPPLGVQYRVERDGYSVSILRIWMF